MARGSRGAGILIAVRAELTAATELSTHDVARWRELATLAAEPNPFFEPEFVLPAAKALEVEPLLLVAIDHDGEWAGAMPVRRIRGWRHVPIRGFSSWRYLYSFFGAPLLRRGCEHDVLETWLSRGEPRLRPYLGLDLLDADGPACTALRETTEGLGANAIVFAQHERAALRRSAEGMNLRTSKKRRRENARLGRRLGEALGGPVEAVDRAADPAAVQEFLALEAAGWKGSRGTALASTPRHADLFREMCAGFQRLGRLQLLSLRANGRTAAMLCSVLAGDTVFGFKTAFDESLAGFSPGIQLQRAHADYFADNQQISLIDTCAEPSNEMANRVWPDRRRIVSIAVPSLDLGGTLSGLLVRGVARTRKIVRKTT